MSELEVESVWDYPRPPLLEPVPYRLTIEVDGLVIADTNRGYRVLETSHPPTYYLPPDDVRADLLEPVSGRSLCEWKGAARYYDLVLPGGRRGRVAWSYPDPTHAFVDIADCLSFYASKMDRCRVGGVDVQAQEGDFYGGWITPNLKGPFKGAPGTMGW